MRMNTSILTDNETARTDPECAIQRAENLAVFGVKSVLELCVGPSLRVLEAAYAQHGISATGNDIDRRWARYYPQGKWEIGDAFSIDPNPYDAVVFAPPVTKGCTGRRIDALRINEVNPSYNRFLFMMSLWGYSGTIVMVLPARSIATSEDRREFHDLVDPLGVPYEVVPLHAERRKIRKYVDIYIGAGIS